MQVGSSHSQSCPRPHLWAINPSLNSLFRQLFHPEGILILLANLIENAFPLPELQVCNHGVLHNLIASIFAAVLSGLILFARSAQGFAQRRIEERRLRSDVDQRRRRSFE